MKVFVYNTNVSNDYEFFKSLSDLESFIDLSVDISTRKKVECVGCTYHTYSLNDESLNNILEFDFDENEPVTFMDASGPASECCFLIKKTNIDFFMDVSSYMRESIKVVREDGDQIIVTDTDCDNYHEVKYEYHGYSGLSDLMSFRFIEVKWYTNEGCFREPQPELVIHSVEDDEK